MNWAPLILAIVFGTPAVVMTLHRKAPRAVAILGALTALCLLAGIPSLLALIGHPLGTGPLLLGIIAGALASATFFYFAVLRGHHSVPLRGLKAIGGGKSSGHARALGASVGAVVFGLAVAMHWGQVVGGIGSGFTQTETSITHSGS